jgi:hypothetical protein
MVRRYIVNAFGLSFAREFGMAVVNRTLEECHADS